MDNLNFEPADIVIYVYGKGIVLKEKSLAALDTSQTKILAFGAEAQALAAQNQEEVRILSPLRQGMIADYSVSVKMFTHFLQKATGRRFFRRPAIAVCIPKGIVDVEKKAVEDAIYQSGARELFIADISVEQLVREIPKKLPDFFKKYKIIIGITKDQPEKYVAERLRQTLEYAASTGISADQVSVLLQSLLANHANH